MYAKTICSVSFPKAWEEAVKFVRESPEKLVFGGGSEVKHAHDSQCTIVLDRNAVSDVLRNVVHPSDPFATQLKLNVSINPMLRTLQDKYDRINSPTIFDRFLDGNMKKEGIGQSATDHINFMNMMR